MRISLRHRILLTLVPLLVLLALLGSAGVVLLQRLGGSIDAILKENYASVIYMERLKEALERIDSSFTFALAGQEGRAARQYQEHWPTFLENLAHEEANITIPGEAELVQRLNELKNRYRKQGDAFHAPVLAAASSVGCCASSPLTAPVSLRETPAQRNADYFGPGGLLDTFKETKDVADAILKLNQDNMEAASRDARQIARESLLGFGLALGAAGLIAIWLAWRTVRDILQPIQAVTQMARAIAGGNLDQVVPVASRDELGQLAEEVNRMARQLRHYRQTDYARLLRAQRTSQASIDSFPDPVLVVDPEGQVEMANPAAQRLLGVQGKTTDQTIGAAWTPPEPLREPLRLALEEQRPYLPEEFDRLVQLRVDGQDHSFLPRLLPIRDPWGHTLGAAVLLQDVTRFRLLDQVKSDLVATASHELKTPLTSIRLAHHLLLEETVGPLNAKQTELLLDARENAERLVRMVNNLLDLARLEKGQAYLELRPQDPAELLQTAADAIAPRAADKGLELDVIAPPGLPRVEADSARLGLALSNLLDNAVNYTERGGHITLSAAAADGGVILSVADTGSGIAPEHLPHVFEKFFRVPGQSRAAGTGLGLAIVREIVVAHGGAVTCESTLGTGSVFRITLPALPA